MKQNHHCIVDSTGSESPAKTTSRKKIKPIKGADLVIRCLERAGVDTVFAYPGGQAIELHQSLIDSKIRVVLPRHEQGGAFAAVGYARATGKTGVCMATSGPGATNLLTGIADAYMDSIPSVFITGQVGLSLIGKNAFQETDIIGITRPIVKHSFLVMTVEEIPQVINHAFRIANTGRPGPVVVDIPKNIQQEFTIPEYPDQIHTQAHEVRHFELNRSEIDLVRNEIRKCRKPCIYAGGGILSADASEALFQFAKSWNIPVATTLMGIGAFPEDDPLSLRWLGMHGTYYANYGVNEADLLLAFGVRFDDRVTGPVDGFAPDATIVHVDIDLSEINKNKRADIGIVADIREFLEAMNQDPRPKEYKDWFAQIASWKSGHPFHYEKKPDVLQPQYVMETLYRLTDGNAIIVPGVGQHQMWAAQYYRYRFPRQLLTSGGLGSMGMGLPSAMGAKIARPDRTVVNVDGDGSFQMNIQEMATLNMERINVKMVILNNQRLGMVAQWEDRFYNGRRGNTILENKYATRPYPDFVTIAKGYGIRAREVFSSEDVEDAVQEMLSWDGPFLLDCHTCCCEHVLPMIPPGKNYKSIIEK